MIGPKLDKMEKDFKNVIFIKVDVEDQGCVSYFSVQDIFNKKTFQEELVEQHEVNVMPTMIIFKNKNIVVLFLRSEMLQFILGHFV